MRLLRGAARAVIARFLRIVWRRVDLLRGQTVHSIGWPGRSWVEVITEMSISCRALPASQSCQRRVLCFSCLVNRFLPKCKISCCSPIADQFTCCSWVRDCYKGGALAKRCPTLGRPPAHDRGEASVAWAAPPDLDDVSGCLMNEHDRLERPGCE